MKPDLITPKDLKTGKGPSQYFFNEMLVITSPNMKPLKLNIDKEGFLYWDWHGNYAYKEEIKCWRFNNTVQSAYRNWLIRTK